MMNARSLGHLSVLSLTAALLVACAASGPTIRSQVDPSANFSAYQTFGFFDEMPGQQALYASFVDQYIKEAIVREMYARGYRQEANPQLLVNFHRQSKDKVKVTQTAAPAGYYGYRRSFYAWGAGTTVTTDVDSYREGTLNIDVVDAAARKLLWEGIAIARISEKIRENPKPTIDGAVNEMFAEFPGRR
jgi:hypothetical protein